MHPSDRHPAAPDRLFCGPNAPAPHPADSASGHPADRNTILENTEQTYPPMNPFERIVIIGSGNLAEALAQAVAGSSARLMQIFARNAPRAAEVARLAGTAWSSRPEELAPADLYLIAVSDRAVTSVASELPIPAGAAVAHTAGSVALDAIPGRFAQRGVFYPLQTFTRGRAVDFRKIPIFIETSTPGLRERLEAFAGTIGGSVTYADSERRAKVHLAGVFACNFANHMYALGERIVRSAGLPFEVLKPLLEETAAKAADAASPADVQTGPAVRGDLPTQQRHAAMLAQDPLLNDMYHLISQSIWEISKKI